MAAIHRGIHAARERADRTLRELGRDLRTARVTRGLSQRVVGAAAALTQSQVSEIERGRYPGVSIDALSRHAVAVGLDLSVRLFPGGEPIRDRAHAALLERFRKAVGEGWDWAAEVPLPIRGDKRAWDRRLQGAGVAIGIEAETRPTDMQEVQRRLGRKKRDGDIDRLILVLPNSEWCRRLLRLNDLETTFPVPGRIALRALQEGRDPGGDAVILL